MPKTMTNKQEMFCREYLVDLNATQAAIRAGYSEKTAGVIGDENLKKPNIQNFIRAMMDKRAEKVELTAEYILDGIIENTDKCKQEGRLALVFRGLELLGRHKKLFEGTPLVDQSKHEHYHLENINARKMPLDRFIKEFTSRLSQAHHR